MKQAIFTAIIAVLILLTSCSAQPAEFTVLEDEEPPADTSVVRPQEEENSLTLEEYFQQWLLSDQGAFFQEGEWSYQVMRSEASMLSVLFTGLREGSAYPVNLVDAYTFCWDENQQVEVVTSAQEFLLQDSADLLMELLVETDDFAYYADYITAEQVEEHLDESIFYLTNTHMVIQFGEDILGPHALGTPAFSISLTELLELLPVQ